MAQPLRHALEGFSRQRQYAAAVQLIQNGLVREGLAVVESIRHRYDGQRRNPWNEFECGSHYARSMASYGLLSALSGFECDMTRGHIGFRPVRMVDGHFKCFWSVASAWGEVDIRGNTLSLRVLYGSLTLQSLGVNLPRRTGTVRATVGRRRVTAMRDGNAVRFGSPVTSTPFLRPLQSEGGRKSHLSLNSNTSPFSLRTPLANIIPSVT